MPKDDDSIEEIYSNDTFKLPPIKNPPKKAWTEEKHPKNFDKRKPRASIDGIGELKNRIKEHQQNMPNSKNIKELNQYYREQAQLKIIDLEEQSSLSSKTSSKSSLSSNSSDDFHLPKINLRKR